MKDDGQCDAGAVLMVAHALVDADESTAARESLLDDDRAPRGTPAVALRTGVKIDRSEGVKIRSSDDAAMRIDFDFTPAPATAA